MKCWACSVAQSGKVHHCGRCDCCRPMTRPDLHGGGGAPGQHSGCALWTFMTINFLTVLLIMICR